MRVLRDDYHGLVACLIANTVIVNKLLNGTENTLAPCNDITKSHPYVPGPPLAESSLCQFFFDDSLVGNITYANQRFHQQLRVRIIKGVTEL